MTDLTAVDANDFIYVICIAIAVTLTIASRRRLQVAHSQR